MHSAKHWLLLLALISGTKTIHAQMCYPVGAYMTLLGRAVAERVRLSNGSSKDIWMLAMDPPSCVIDKRYSQDTQGKMSVSRVQIVGAVPLWRAAHVDGNAEHEKRASIFHRSYGAIRGAAQRKIGSGSVTARLNQP